MAVFLAQEFHDITGPMDYFLLQPWMIFCAVAGLLLLIGLTIWLIKRWRNRPVAVKTPRQRARSPRAGRDRNRQADALSIQHPRFGYPAPLRHGAISIAGHAPDFGGISQRARRHFAFLRRRAIAPQRFPESLRPDQVRALRRDPEDSRLLLDEADRFVKGGALEPA